MAGIDITVFTAHSTRSASTSKANNMGLAIKDICKAAGWRTDSCFRKHYNLYTHSQKLWGILIKWKDIDTIICVTISVTENHVNASSLA